ncbi:MAG: radical SAM protein [Bacillota bacterium]
MLVTLYLTDMCNLDCSYCYFKNKTKNRLTHDQIGRVIDFVFEQIKKSNEGSIGIVFSGGEPLLEFPLLANTVTKVINEAARLDVSSSFVITTNGTLLSCQVIDFLKNKPISLAISIDGPEHIHSEHRPFVNGSPTFSTVECSLKTAISEGLSPVARITFTPATVGNLANSVKYLAELGCSEIKPVPDYFNSDWDEKSFAVCKAEIREIANWLSENPNVTIPVLTQKSKRPMKPCYAGADHSYFVIGPDANLYPCSYVVNQPEFRIGNILEGFDDEKIMRIYSGVSSEERKNTCGKCAYFECCESARCVLVNYRLSGNINLPSGFYCQYQQLLFSLTDKFSGNAQGKLRIRARKRAQS